MEARILVVEDDALLGFELARHLERAGLVVVGPATSVATALALLARVGCDAAVLDLHLGRRETSEQVAVELKARGIPFVTVTGYLHEQCPPAFNGPLLSKPVSPADLISELIRCLAGS